MSDECVIVIVAAMVMYEYLITFEDEVTTVWKRKFNLTSTFLLSVRWTMVVATILWLLPTSPIVRL